MSVLTIRNGAFVPGVTQNITTTGTAQESNAVSTTTSIVRITCQQDTYVAVGNSSNTVTATTSSMIILGGGTEYLALEPFYVDSSNANVTGVISVLQVANSGIVSITQLTGYST